MKELFFMILAILCCKSNLAYKMDGILEKSSSYICPEVMMYHIHELDSMKEFYLKDVNNPKTNIIIKKYPEIHKKLSESVMNFCYYYSLNGTGEPRGFINQSYCKDYKEEKSDKKISIIKKASFTKK